MSKDEELLQEIERQWPGHIARGMRELVDAHDEQFYAAAFWLFYCDYTVIHPPAFGANAEDWVRDEDENEFTTRWLPAEWKWDVLRSVYDGMLPLYLQLSEALAGASKDHWNAVIAAHYELIPRVARSVTKAARSRSGDFRDLALSDHFLVFAVDDGEEPKIYNQLVRASIDPAELPALAGMLVPEE